MTNVSGSPMGEEIIITSDHRVSCNGDGGALGHPRIFLEMGNDGDVTCGYCDRRFILKNGPADPNQT